MIYFIQRKSDGLVTFGLTSNLENTLSDIGSEYGDVQLLGVMNGGEKELFEKWQDWGIFHDEDEDDWVWDIPEVLDWIKYNSATSISSLKSSAQYKMSDYTPIKQRSLDGALRQQLSIVAQITKRFNNPQSYQYYELHSGPGTTDSGNLGSPLIFQRIATRFWQQHTHFNFQATFFEADKTVVTKLKNALGQDPRIHIRNEDHKTFIDELDRIAHETSPKKRKWVFGTVYADPSNAELPWELLEKFNEVYPAIDIMINIACASYKRTISQVGYKTLAERLPRIKSRWIVRRPYGKHQWSILIGSNWKKYPAWEKFGFYPWKGSELGEYYFEILTLTKEQRSKARQKRLF